MSEVEAAPAETKVNIVNPPNFLRLKSNMVPGSLDEILARADRMVAALQGEFEAGAEIRIRKLADIAKVKWPMLATRDEAVREMRRVCHDIKGEAGTFGYPLLTDIADLFGDYMRETSIELQRKEAIKGYIDAFVVVWTQRIKGEGGELGKQLIASLSKLNERSQARA